MSTIDDTDEQDPIIDEGSEEIIHYATDADTTCTICNAEFLDPEDLKIHLDQVHKVPYTVIRTCQFCPQRYTDLMDYAVHIRDVHLTSLKCCIYCMRIFDDFDKHRSHCKKHIIGNSESVYSCSQCKQRHANLSLLKRHEYEHNGATEGVMLYEVLPYLSVALKVKSINFLEALGTDVSYICVGCDFTTVDMSIYLKHVRKSDCKVHVCSMCCNVFKRKRNLMTHLCSNMGCNMFGIKDKMTKLCIECNTYINIGMYAKHKVKCKPIKCHACDITFPNMNDWSEHQSKDHPSMSIEVETCQYCWKRCVGSVAMKRHIEKAHEHEFHLYKYLCIYCKAVFKHPQKLFAHFFTKHKEIYPYMCKICDKIFRLRKKFTIHIKLAHKSVGFVEFDDKYHVFFTDKKSEKPFIPKSFYINGTEENPNPESSKEDSGNIELNSDFMNATETEGNQTEPDIKKEPKVKRKRTTKMKKAVDDSITIESSEDEDDQPLLEVRKRIRLQKNDKPNIVKRKRVQQTNKTLLTCNICKKYCYTFQNYNHHVSLHSKHEFKKCIKCLKIFKSKLALNEHIAKEHSSSKLTETLKTLLEKRKNGSAITDDLPTSEKFRRTIKKAKTEFTSTSAKITAVDHKLSVQKFFENFVPEDNKPDMLTNSKATIKLVTEYPREPAIKLTKFKPSSINTSQKLAMPVKFVDHYPEKTKVTVKQSEPICRTEESREYYSDNYDDGDRNDSIPDVAEEIMLENTEEVPKPKDVAHRIVIPKLPSELGDIRIAHLLPQAPFYKIVKVKDVLVQNTEEEEKEEVQKQSLISLPDGTKLVTTNPLAHLLGNKQQKVLESVKNKYYKPKVKNFQGMLAKALTVLDKPTPPKRKKREEYRNIEFVADDEGRQDMKES